MYNVNAEKKNIRAPPNCPADHCLDQHTVLYSTSPNTQKVTQREIFVTELFTLSDPIWVDDLWD